MSFFLFLPASSIADIMAVKELVKISQKAHHLQNEKEHPLSSFLKILTRKRNQHQNAYIKSAVLGSCPSYTDVCPNALYDIRWRCDLYRI